MMFQKKKALNKIKKKILKASRLVNVSMCYERSAEQPHLDHS